LRGKGGKKHISEVGKVWFNSREMLASANTRGEGNQSQFSPVEEKKEKKRGD